MYVPVPGANAALFPHDGVKLTDLLLTDAAEDVEDAITSETANKHNSIEVQEGREEDQQEMEGMVD